LFCASLQLWSFDCSGGDCAAVASNVPLHHPLGRRLVKEIEIDSFCPPQAQAVGGQCSFSRFYYQKKKGERWEKNNKQQNKFFSKFFTYNIFEENKKLTYKYQFRWGTYCI
jgi:hypothetical protein